MSREPLLSQITRIVNSDLLRGSESLCKLLRYLADQSLEHPGSSTKEYQIAIEVFGRPSDFDPRLDSTVRVQTSRLRSKLAEYYAGEGASDRILVELPKGSYAIAVHARAIPEPPHYEAPPEVHPDPPRSNSNVAVWSLSFLCGGLALALVYLTLGRTPDPSPAVQREDTPASLRNFWYGFVDRPEQPWVVFSNAEFVGRPETGMRYFDPKRDDKSAILDHYTGVGEVLAIHELDRVFTQLHHAVLIKRGRLMSVDDAKNNDLIFVGSPSENLTLRDLPTTQQFIFRIADKGPRKGDLAIVNVQPKPGEEPAYFGSPGNPISEDYALIGLAPGLTSTHWVLILAGTTTIGTQAAVEFVCRSSTVDSLMKRLSYTPKVGVQPFEAVLRTKVSRGVPVSSEIVALHSR